MVYFRCSKSKAKLDRVTFSAHIAALGNIAIHPNLCNTLVLCYVF